MLAKFKALFQKLDDPLYQRVKAEAFSTVNSDRLRHDNYHYLTRIAKWYTLRIKNGSDESVELELMKDNIKTMIW